MNSSWFSLDWVPKAARRVMFLVRLNTSSPMLTGEPERRRQRRRWSRPRHGRRPRTGCGLRESLMTAELAHLAPEGAVVGEGHVAAVVGVEEAEAEVEEAPVPVGQAGEAPVGELVHHVHVADDGQRPGAWRKRDLSPPPAGHDEQHHHRHQEEENEVRQRLTSNPVPHLLAPAAGNS
ncbi:uncharacterized protein A4U43_C05F6370 [Asparagus officinalis]|uniref:Uncharacterized protein n=1 Tax=Asparagus officinalis TaxID=4686 RepID=A0A5P1EPS6_ASPOF|nr:uncharacterized protein A4U43_C05F6370 [Asparagus officinalis]